jgi:predicted negative regulator of RcsB-dependent stress response
VDPFISEDEDLKKFKEWWKQNGMALIAGVVLGLGIVGGTKYWSYHKQQRAEEASALYEQMFIQYTSKHAGPAQTAGARLMEKFEDTPYAGMAALYMAKISYETDDLKSARSQLQWAVDNALEQATVHTARLRLARLMEDAREYDQALALVDVKDEGAFSSDYQELRGDLLLAKGDTDAARTAYQEALRNLSDRSRYRPMLKMKLDDIGGAEG